MEASRNWPVESSPMVLRFGPFALDVPRRLLTRDGHAVHLTPKAFDVLTLLVTQRPRAVPKDEVLSTVWRGVFVTESTLATTIRDLRHALDDDASEPRYIRTVYAFGHAFVAEAESAGDAAGPEPSPWRLVSDGGDVPLHLGANVVGRVEPGVLTIDAPTISRRHARLTVTAVSVTCEDLGSKNGTWIGTARVTAPTAAQDGDEIRFGSVVTVLRRRGTASTQTMAVLEAE